MRFTSPFFGLVALATMSIASPHADYRSVINDFNSLRAIAIRLEGHVQHFDIMNMVQDKNAIINGFQQVFKDAMAIERRLTSPEATEVLSSEDNLAQEIHRLAGIVIGHRGDVPVALHGAIRNDLLTIAHYAEQAGKAVVNDCPGDKRQEASKINSGIAEDLDNAVRAFSS